jgi:hypothetical protein
VHVNDSILIHQIIYLASSFVFLMLLLGKLMVHHLLVHAAYIPTNKTSKLNVLLLLLGKSLVYPLLVNVDSIPDNQTI